MMQDHIIVAIGRKPHVMIGYGGWPRGQVTGILFITGKEKLHSITVSLSFGYKIIETAEDVKEYYDCMQDLILEEKVKIKAYEKSLELLDLSEKFLKKLNFSKSKASEDLILVKYSSVMNHKLFGYSYHISHTFFGVLSQDHLEIVRDYKPLDRFRALKDLEVYSVKIPLLHGRITEHVTSNKIKSKSLRELKEEKARVAGFLKGTYDALSLIEDMIGMLNKVNIKDKVECAA